MLGPLPRFYRVVVSTCALAAFIGLGAWLTSMLPVPALTAPTLTLTGAGFGAALGLVAVLLFLHDFDHPHSRENRVRVLGNHRR